MVSVAENPLISDLLRSLDLGSSVAEFDKSLEKYFVENEAFNALITDRADVIAGDKGTGKTAVYRILQKRFGSIPELKGIEVLAGFNPVGNPIFQKLVRQVALTEAQYVTVWKAYIFSLVGNWIIGITGENESENFKRLNQLLTDTGLRSADDKPETIFSKIVNSIQRALLPKKAEIEFTISETGIPVVIPRIEFGSKEAAAPKEVPHEQALRLLNDCLDEIDYSVWLVLDRLDEAFQGFPDVEVPALRALLRTYLDIQEFPRVRLKLFVRRDLFRKIIGTSFVNLTHINARKKEIVWEEADLLNLLAKRIRENDVFMKAIEDSVLSDEEKKEIPKKVLSDMELFYILFPSKVDPGKKKPVSLNWAMSRIKDGNTVKPPRNLIDLVNLAREAQIRAETRDPQRLRQKSSLINAESLKNAHSRLSAQRVEDTLLAESASGTAALIEKFRKSKAEHSLQTLATTLGMEGDQLNAAIRQLVEVGFLEALRASWKVPG